MNKTRTNKTLLAGVLAGIMAFSAAFTVSAGTFTKKLGASAADSYEPSAEILILTALSLPLTLWEQERLC